MRGFEKYSALFSAYEWRYGDPAGKIIELLVQPAVDGWHHAERMFRPAFRLAPRDPLIDRLGSARAIVGIAINAALFAQFIGLSRAGSAAPDMLLKPFVTALAGFVVCPLAIAAFVLLASSDVRDETQRQMRWPLRALGFGLASCAALAVPVLLAVPVWRYIHSLAWWPLILLLCVPPLYFLVVRLAGFVLRMVFLVAKYWFNAVDGHPLLAPVVATGVTWVSAIYDVASGVPDFLPTWIYAVTVAGSVVTVTTLSALEGWRVHKMYAVNFRSGPWPVEQTTCARCGREDWFAGRVCRECSPGDPNEATETVAGAAVAAVVFLGITWLHWSPPPEQAAAAAPPAIVFQSPSGNVVCLLTRTTDNNPGGVTARCDAPQISYRPPPPPAGCTAPGFGRTLVLAAGRAAQFACAPAASARPGAEKLAYGKTIALETITCRSATDGITCRDTSGHGFRLERDSARLTA